MNKKDKEIIKQLKNEGKFEEIYNKYGRKEYIKNASYEYKKQDILKLKQETNFEELKCKYGKKEYKKMQNNIYYEQLLEDGKNRKAILFKKKIQFKMLVRTFAFSVLIGIPTSVIGCGVITKYKIKENSETYKKQINEYDIKISNYIKELRKYGHLTYTQLFIKSYADLWKNGEKGNPEKDITGYLELDFLEDNGKGVCRNAAYHIAKELNKYDENLNARTLAVYVESFSNYKSANIGKLINKKEVPVPEKEKSMVIKCVEKINGNHMVVLVDIKEDGITLALDPMNPGIGLYKDGNIVMFNSKDGSEIVYHTREHSEITVNKGIDSTFDVIGDFIDSFKDNSKLSYEEIKEKYGLEAQNRAVDELLEMQNKRANSDFRNRLKVDIDYNEVLNDYNVKVICSEYEK